MSFFPTAYAQATDAAAGAAHQGSPWSTVIMLVVFFAIFYFLLIRPQSKRAKAQRTLIAGLTAGDEVVTTGGIMGKIDALDETAVTLEIADKVKIKIQKAAIASVLPKGTVSF
jgi:preprotein translocase subunit YajC